MRNKKKNIHNFWKRIRFKYRLSAFNENTLEEVWRIRASIFSGAALFLLFAAVLITVTSVIIIQTPIRYYLPGYLDSEVREKAVRNAVLIDSLEMELSAHHLYMDNVRRILSGTMSVDSITSIADTLYIAENDSSLLKSELERRFVEQYAEEEKYTLSLLPYSSPTDDAVVLFSPMKGIVSARFEPKNDRYGVEIQGTGKSTVTSVARGVVIFSGYDLYNGYVIQVQHKNGYVSIYKGCSVLLKAVGDKVKPGEAIGTLDMQQADGKEQLPLLRFELWHDGYAVNPEDYISF